MIDFAKPLTSLVDWLLQLRGEQRKEVKAAAVAIRSAAIETELLFAIARTGAVPSHEQKASVARLWATASSEFRTVDRQVSDGCFEISKLVVRCDDFSEWGAIELASALAKTVPDAMQYFKTAGDL